MLVAAKLKVLFIKWLCFVAIAIPGSRYQNNKSVAFAIGDAWIGRFFEDAIPFRFTTKYRNRSKS